MIYIAALLLFAAIAAVGYVQAGPVGALLMLTVALFLFVLGLRRGRE